MVQASTEETVTRGYMLQSAGSQMKGSLAVGLVAIVFAVAHVDFHPLVLLNIALYSLMASFVSLARGSLWLACGFHIGWNAFQGNVFGLPVSGNPYQVSIWAIGPGDGSQSVLTGGDFGIEGGLVTTCLWGLGALAAYVYWRRVSLRREPFEAADPSSLRRER